MQKKGNNVNQIAVVLAIIVILVIALSIGWASFNSSLQFDSAAMVRIKSDIRVTGFNYVYGTNNALSSNENYNVKSVFGTINLPDISSTVKYRVEITNMQLAASVNMGINSLSGLPNNLDVLSIEDYSLKTKICDDNNSNDCGTGAQKTFYITIGYKNSSSFDASNTEYNFNLDFEFKKVHDIIYTGFTNPPISPKTVMDGDVVTISFGSDANDVIRVISGGANLVLNTDYTYQNKVLNILTPIRDDVHIVNPSIFSITYVLNGGVQANGQITSFSMDNPENILAPTKEGYNFGGWYETSDFKTEVITSTSQLTGNTTLYASWGNGIAKIGNDYYSTLQEAINHVPTNNEETTVVLLSNTSELLTVASGKNIVFDLQNYTISNPSDGPVIQNNGSIKISNGTITSDATQGVINVNSGASLVMTGGTITMTGTKQAIYNDKGTVTISGTAYLSSTSTQRAAVQNQAGSTLTITGGTIISTRYYGVDNKGTMTIGTSDGNVSITSPSITGSSYGISSNSNYSFYDGIIKGKTDAVNNINRINHIESGYFLDNSTEDINGDTYKTLRLMKKAVVTFNPNEGTVSEATRNVNIGSEIGTLPKPIRNNYIFEGWFTELDDGREITSTEIITDDVEFFAHWISSSEVVVARIDNTDYSSVQQAVDAAKNNKETTITLVRDTIENVTISAKKNIVLDLGNYKIDNGTSYSSITNNGKLKLISGTITSNSDSASAVNNNSGATFVMTGGSIIATGKRQAVYNDGGTVTISGGTLTAKAFVENSNHRGTVQNLANSTITITGGTITSSATNGIAFTNLGTATIGIKDGNISSSSPILNGLTTGVNNTGTLNFYDGIIRGTNITIDGNINEIEDNATRIDSTETINGVTYQTTTLN